MKKKIYKKVIRSLRGRIEVLEELLAAEREVRMALIARLEKKK